MLPGGENTHSRTPGWLRGCFFFDELGLFLLGFSLFHNFSVHLFQRMGDSIWQIEEEDDLVVLDFVQHLAAYDVGDPVVSEVVLCDRLVVFDDGDELFLSFINGSL